MKLIIIGCGRVGSELATSISSQGHEVVIIDPDQAAFNRLGESFRGRTIEGDPRDEAILRRAGIEHADGLAVVTPSDELNLVVARTAKAIFDLPNVVARVYDPSHQEAFQAAGIQIVVSSSWGAQRIEQLLTHPGLIEVASFGHHDLLLIEAHIPDAMHGRTIESLSMPGQIRPLAIIRAGRATLSEQAQTLERGDLLLIAVESDALPLLEQVMSQDKED